MKIWLYYANAGGGHRGPARALAAALEQRGATTTLIDLAEGAFFLRKLFEGGYAFFSNYVPWGYALLYEVSKWRPVMAFEQWLSGILTVKYFRHLLLQDKPDAIVATYFLIAPLMRAMRQLELVIPVVMVVTDPYSVHPIWLYYPTVQYVVASEQAALAAQQAYVHSTHIHVLPQVVPISAGVITDPAVLTALASPQKKVLVIGGGNGLPGGLAVVRALLASALDAQFIIVAGKDEKLYNQVLALQKQSAKNILVFGFVDFVGELLERTDVVVAKAGASVIREAVLHKKPIVVAHYIWGQEQGNMEFVVNNELGVYEPKPERIPAAVTQVLANNEKIVQKYSTLDLQNGTDQAAEFIISRVPNRN